MCLLVIAIQIECTIEIALKNSLTRLVCLMKCLVVNPPLRNRHCLHWPQWIFLKYSQIHSHFVFTGFSLRALNLSADSIMLISYPGELFMRVLKLMILPLIISSLIAGSASLNAKMNGKIALRTLVYFATTSFFNAILGIFLVTLIHPGDPGLHKNDIRPISSKPANLLDSLLDLGR